MGGEPQGGKHSEEGVTVPRDDEVERALGIRRCLQVERGEEGGGALRHRLTRAKDGHARELLRDRGSEELVVRAAERHYVRACLDGAREDGPHGGAGRLGHDLAALDQRGEVVSDDAVDDHALAELLHDTVVEVAVEGAGRGEDGDAPAPGGERRGLDARDHAHEGHIEQVAQLGDGGGGRGVAGDDDELRAEVDKPPRDGEGALAHLGGIAGTVGEPGRIGEIDRALARGEAPELTENAQSANAGVEQADRSQVHRQEDTASTARRLRGRAPPPAGAHDAPMTRRIEVALLPAEAAAIEADAFLVIDVLRATTTIAALFAGGLAELLVLDRLEAARERARAEGRILFGEVGGLPPAGFDHGNSPADAATLALDGRRAALFTTNGTRALCGVAGRGAVAAAAFANAAAAARWAAGFERVALVCAGAAGGERFALEDFAAAARLVQLIARERPGVELGDAAGLAAEATGYEDWIAPGLPQRTGRSARLVAGARHARALKALGLTADIAFAAREDTSQALPLVVERGEGWALLRDGR